MPSFSSFPAHQNASSQGKSLLKLYSRNAFAQNVRGGRVNLMAIAPPVPEFSHPEKGEALYAMELALR